MHHRQGNPQALGCYLGKCGFLALAHIRFAVVNHHPAVPADPNDACAAVKLTGKGAVTGYVVTAG